MTGRSVLPVRDQAEVAAQSPGGAIAALAGRDYDWAMTTEPGDDDFEPTATWPILEQRAALLRRARAFFDGRGFLEVETPLLSHDTVVDRQLDPFRTVLARDPQAPDQGASLWLQTSPEFAMKRLLAAGAPAIYQVAKVFRNGEIGARHNPEFTMLEWYRPGDSYAAGKQLLADLCTDLLRLEPPDEISYAEAFQTHLGLDPHRAPTADLIRAAEELGIAAPASLSPDDRDVWLELLLGERIEPRLGFDRPAILYDYPATQAALAQIRSGDPPVAERFELYVRGVELANGFHELLDPAVLRARNQANNLLRRADGKPELPAESRLLRAMERGLPNCTGCALGFDRLVMLAVGAASIQDVLAFPIERA
ncbi:MAG TPA: EF-P lysine aminoacylase EpmA [Pirellulales bacterium]|jgi:lysyl-tRNA synthetase class 2|nr:EF-P lysine aminoacylase EpmA [Pirellulales bacterium]